MKRKILLLLFLSVLACSTVFSQYKLQYWAKDCSICDKITVDGRTYNIFKTEEFTLAFEGGDDGDYFIANVFLQNNSKDKRIEFNPTSARLAVWTESDVKKNDFPTLYEPVPAEKIAAKLEKRAKWANFFAAMSGAFATKTTTSNETGNVSITDNRGNTGTGTYNSTIETTTTDKQAQANVQRQITNNNNQASTAASGYLGSALRANTIFPQNNVMGNIYFPRKKYAKVAIGIEINGTHYAVLFKK